LRAKSSVGEVPLLQVTCPVEFLVNGGDSSSGTTESLGMLFRRWI
jgi:hypothetical protein